ncbi:MAG: rhomboid family intramembrane serine protease [Oscillospiraceae bacterium]|nr:rhomboid family intramembrane serine protease [Oscillospiraceae bacterium]
MKDLRRNFERFCYKHRYKGIPNLMLVIAIGMAVVYLFMQIDPSNLFYHTLRFDRNAILQGQVWRLLTYIFIPSYGNIFLLAISMYFYFFIGKAIEGSWGTLRFNLFYLCGVIITDIAALLLHVNASSASLNLSLLLAFATLYPENQVLLFFIIPLKMKYLAWFYFAMTIYDAVRLNFFPVFALLNYFIFFGGDIVNVLPDFMKPNGGYRRAQRPNANWAKDYQKKASKPLYRHKCTVCGRTDTEHPHLEFRYCSKCSGYYCYCLDHINDHAHIQ